MTNSIIWLHDTALRISHPVFSAAPQDAKVIFIWDDAYFKSRGYSLKRLVFIYETLCSLSIDIILGNSLKILMELKPTELYIPLKHNAYVDEVLYKLSREMKIHLVPDEIFASIPKNCKFWRFFQYWKKVEKSAFLVNGGIDA